MCVYMDLFLYMFLLFLYAYNLRMWNACVVYVCDCEFDDFVGLRFLWAFVFIPGLAYANYVQPEGAIKRTRAQFSKKKRFIRRTKISASKTWHERVGIITINNNEVIIFSSFFSKCLNYIAPFCSVNIRQALGAATITVGYVCKAKR